MSPISVSTLKHIFNLLQLPGIKPPLSLSFPLSNQTPYLKDTKMSRYCTVRKRNDIDYEKTINVGMLTEQLQSHFLIR